MFEGDRRLTSSAPARGTAQRYGRHKPSACGAARVGEGRQGFVPLSTIASVELAPGPNQVSREDGKRRIVVSANVRGRDMGSFVAQAQQELESAQLPSGYWTRWGGTFESLESARQRLMIVVPVALTLVFTLLFAMFGNVRMD